MDEDVIEEILFPLYLECQSMDGDEKVAFAQKCTEIIYSGVDKWFTDEIELDDDDE